MRPFHVCYQGVKAKVQMPEQLDCVVGTQQGVRLLSLL